MARMLLLSSKSREQKKLAPSFPSTKPISVNVWAIVDFPVPANPFSQKTGWTFSSINHCSICKRTSFLVPLRHPFLSPQRYPASAVWFIPLRRDRSTASYLPVSGHGGVSWSRTYDELVVALVIDVLLQRSLGTTLDGVKAVAVGGTSLVIRHCVTGILSEASQSLRVLNVFEETGHFPLLGQRFQILENLF